MKPEFANAIEDCTDTTKLYVLPDGYIYAYLRKEILLYTNQIPLSVDENKQPYIGENGEIGYVSGRRIVVSTGALEMTSTYATETTGYIPIAKNNVLYFKDFDYLPGQDGKSLRSISLFKSDFSHQITIQPQNISDAAYMVTYTTYESGHIETLTIVDKYNNGLAYVRFNAPDVSKSIITVNEQIVDPIYDYVWSNTKHQIVPTDCEPRIIPLETSVESHETRIKSLEMYGSDSTSAEDIPAYIKTEADGVMNRLIEKQGNRCFTMVAMSDFHYSNYASGTTDNRDNLIRACKAVSYINGRIHVDAVAVLGDNTPFGPGDSKSMERAHNWNREVNEILKSTEGTGIKRFRTPGNHDRLGAKDDSGVPTPYLPDNAVYTYYCGNSDGIMGDVPGGWHHYDFESYKLRVITLNTSECEGVGRFSDFSGYHMSAKQHRWLIDTLDMSDKPDAEDWQILILSHHRPDDWQEYITETDWGENGYILPNILHAYRTGSSFTGTKPGGEIISCDFSGKNKARLIGSIHGHHHAYIYSKLYLGPQENSSVSDIMAISTPTTGFGTGAGHNDDNDNNWYDSVKDTASETAFCVYSIDLDNHVVHAIHYGNGIDREISYD